MSDGQRSAQAEGVIPVPRPKTVLLNLSCFRTDSDNAERARKLQQIFSVRGRTVRVRDCNENGAGRGSSAWKSSSSGSMTGSSGQQQPAMIRINHMSYQRIPMMDDGNCFFRAIAFWVYGNQNQHMDVRQLIVKHISNNWDRYRVFIVGDDSYHNRIRSLYDYIECMEHDGTFGGSQECVATSELFNVKLVIYTVENLKVPQVYGPAYDNTFTLLFSGSHDNGHFDVIIQNDHVALDICEPRQRPPKT